MADVTSGEAGGAGRRRRTAAAVAARPDREQWRGSGVFVVVLCVRVVRGAFAGGRRAAHGDGRRGGEGAPQRADEHLRRLPLRGGARHGAAQRGGGGGVGVEAWRSEGGSEGGREPRQNTRRTNGAIRLLDTNNGGGTRTHAPRRVCERARAPARGESCEQRARGAARVDAKHCKRT